jgi:hypothetical protein
MKAVYPPAGNLPMVIDDSNSEAAPEYPNRYATIPPNGRRCQFTGLGHAKLYQILGPDGVARRRVRVANLRMPGAARGQTLFHVGDMLRFLDLLAQQSTTETNDHRERGSKFQSN